MQTMDQALLDLYLNKQGTMEEALNHTMHPEELRRMIDNAAHGK
jgi:Tfp pilus assembly ATPase PilU